MQQLKYALAGLLFLSPAIAFADDPPATTEGSTEAGASADASAGGAGASASAEVGTTGGEATAAAGATVVGEGIINESYLAAKSKIVLFGGLGISHLSIDTGAGSVSATQEGLHVGVGYGVTDKITAGAVYSFPIAGDGTDDTKGKGPLGIYGEFELVHNDKLNVAASADFTYDLCGGFDADGCTGTKAIHAGLGARYLVAPKVAIFTGAPIGPGPVGNHLFISLEDKGPINFDLPIGVGLQATPQIYAYLETNLLHFRISNKPDGADAVSVLGSDIEKGGIGIPLLLGGFFSATPQLDVGANIGFVDLGHAGDFYQIGLDARFKM